MSLRWLLTTPVCSAATLCLYCVRNVCAAHSRCTAMGSDTVASCRSIYHYALACEAGTEFVDWEEWLSVERLVWLFILVSFFFFFVYYLCPPITFFFFFFSVCIYVKIQWRHLSEVNLLVLGFIHPVKHTGSYQDDLQEGNRFSKYTFLIPTIKKEKKGMNNIVFNGNNVSLYYK